MTSDIKKMSFIDNERQKIVQLNCKLKNGINKGDINIFKNYLHTLNFDNRFFKQDKSIIDLEKEYCNMLYGDTLDFGRILSIYSSPDLIKTEFVKDPVIRFLGLFEIVNEEEKDLKDLEVLEIAMRHHNFIGKIEREKIAKEANSIHSNTLLFKDSSKEEIIKIFHKKENYMKVKQIISKRAIG